MIPTLPYFVSEAMAKATKTLTPKKDQAIPDHIIIEGLKVLLIQSDKRYCDHCKTNTHTKAKCNIQYGRNVTEHKKLESVIGEVQRVTEALGKELDLSCDLSNKEDRWDRKQYESKKDKEEEKTPSKEEEESTTKSPNKTTSNPYIAMEEDEEDEEVQEVPFQVNGKRRR